ncbi:hypothetical protein GBAR_LOCUS20678 [Geodia barretti]|uniref:5'-AMP-activated protein kinase subunit beta-1 n=3 Tax=Geodia barretti TaxID=519541 RepID=A0AA35SWE4_GEOBA|nr:hypothetical protein GBAR_LOCUS20678 [Geodia barretti]
MTKKDGGSYLSTLDLPLESSFEYKFVVDGQWKHKDDMPVVNDPFGGHNNILSTGSPPP